MFKRSTNQYGGEAQIFGCVKISKMESIVEELCETMRFKSFILKVWLSVAMPTWETVHHKTNAWLWKSTVIYEIQVYSAPVTPHGLLFTHVLDGGCYAISLRLIMRSWKAGNATRFQSLIASGVIKILFSSLAFLLFPMQKQKTWNSMIHLENL